MSWGKLKPFWQSKAWKKSAEAGTGVFSWGDSDLLKGFDLLIPGWGTSLDSSFDQLAKMGKEGDFGHANTGSSISGKQAVNVASFASNNQLALYGLIGLVAYKVIFK
tara:strand:+ start:1123 stop:1443 length:321 start_codon:yes stop_codon:yes gene_type:complete